MSLKSSKLSDNSKKPIVISRKPLTWLEHAEKHFQSGTKFIMTMNETHHKDGSYTYETCHEDGSYTYETYHKDGSYTHERFEDYVLVDKMEEHLMFLCLFSHAGMFDTQF